MPDGPFDNPWAMGATIPGIPSISGAVNTAVNGGGGSSNPIMDAANIQADALQDAIPYFDPYYNAGLTGLEGFAGASTAQGLDQMLASIMSGDAFPGLMDARRQEVESMLASSGLRRSGEAIDAAAAIPTDLALTLEGILTGRQGQLAESGFAAGSNIADLTAQVAQAIASGILGVHAQDIQSDANRESNLFDLAGSILSGGGLSSVFSDPSLKENIRVMGKIGPLDLVEWDWIEDAKGTMVENMPTRGVLSTQVREHYPAFVSTFGGFDVIDYKGLYNHLSELCH